MRIAGYVDTPVDQEGTMILLDVRKPNGELVGILIELDEDAPLDVSVRVRKEPYWEDALNG